MYSTVNKHLKNVVAVLPSTLGILLEIIFSFTYIYNYIYVFMYCTAQYKVYFRFTYVVEFLEKLVKIF